MTPQSLLHFADPRLQLQVAEARPEDVMTRSALRLLDEAISGVDDHVLSAPAIGLPVRCLAIREGAEAYLLMNPNISAASDFRLNRAETCIHTGPIQRHVWRANRITVTGTYLTGYPFKKDFEARNAIRIQQAIQQMDCPNLFDWITPFHRGWMTSRNEVARARCAALNSALHAAPDHPATPLAALSERMAQACDDKGDPIAQIDLLNTSLPVAPLDRRCMGILFAASAMRNVLMLSPEFFGLAVSALATLPVLQVHLQTPDWPQEATNALGLGGAMRQAPPENPDAPPEAVTQTYDAIFATSRAPVLSDPEHRTQLRQLARRLTGRGGIFVVTSPEPQKDVEQRLQAVFPSLYVVETPDVGLIYVATKERLDLGAIRARLMTMAAQTGLHSLVRAGSEGWFEVLNSGDRLTA